MAEWADKINSSSGFLCVEMVEEIKLGRYRHFKGKDYEVIGMAKHSETLEKFVVYRALYGNRELYIRPKKMFLEKVGKEGKLVKRFEYTD